MHQLTPPLPHLGLGLGEGPGKCFSLLGPRLRCLFFFGLHLRLRLRVLSCLFPGLRGRPDAAPLRLGIERFLERFLPDVQNFFGLFLPTPTQGGRFEFLDNIKPCRPELYLCLRPPSHHLLTLSCQLMKFLWRTFRVVETLGPKLGPFHLEMKILFERVFPRLNGPLPGVRRMRLSERLCGLNPLVPHFFLSVCPGLKYLFSLLRPFHMAISSSHVSS